MNINKILTKKFISYLPFIIFFIIILVWHLSLIPMIDDLWFSKFTISNLPQFTVSRYLEWTSRNIIELNLIVFLNLPLIIWKIVDTFIFTGICVLIVKLFTNKNQFFYGIISSILMLLFIYSSYVGLASAGYVSSNINYIWPLFFGLLHFYLLKKYLFTDYKLRSTKKIVLYLGLILSLILSINNEQLCLIIFGIYFFKYIYLIYTKQNIPKFFHVLFLIIILMIINVIISPGNQNRAILELKWYPEFKNLNLLDKLNMGISHLLHRCVTTCDITTMVFLGLIGFYVTITTKNLKKSFISFIPLLISIGFWVLILTNNVFLLVIMNENILTNGYVFISYKRLILSLAIYTIYIGSFIYSLYQIYSYNNEFEKSRKFIYTISTLVIIGICSGILFGFTPSLPSMERMYIYFYSISMICGFLLIIQIRKILKYNLNGEK